MSDLDTFWRRHMLPRYGGAGFDRPGTGYSFSAVLSAERELAAQSVPDQPSSALCCLSVADPTVKMPFEAMEAGMEYYRSNPQATRYTDNNGILGTHEGIAEFLNMMHPHSHVVFTADWVQYSPGSIKRALAEFMPSLLLDSETLLLFPNPSYAVMKNDINIRQAKIEDIPLVLSDGRYYVDYGRMTDLVVASRLDGMKRAVLYLNIPHNPTGTTFSSSDWADLISWATKNNVIVVVDEAYTHLRYNESGSVLDIAGWEQCCVVLQSISKGWNATGLRMGWIIAHPTLIKAVRKITDVKDSGGFGPNIASMLWCLENPEFAMSMRNHYYELHRDLIAGLGEVGFKGSMPEAGLCLLTEAPTSADGVVFADATECTKWLRQHKRISLMPVTISGNAWLRWAVTIFPQPEYGLPDHGSVIAEVVRRLKETKFKF